jgi:hypothetical protein
MKRFIVRLTGITLVIALISWLVFSLAIPEYYLPVFPFLLLFFYFITIAIYAWQLKQAQNDMGKFSRSTMLITFFKLILYVVAAIIYIALDSENAIPFVICLIILYLIYTFYEVAEITKILKK